MNNNPQLVRIPPPLAAPTIVPTLFRPSVGPQPSIDDSDSTATRTVLATKLSSPANETTPAPTVAPVPNFNSGDAPPPPSLDGSASADNVSNNDDSSTNLASTDSLNAPQTGSILSLPVLVGMGIMIGVFIVVMAIFANKYYHRRKKHGFHHDADIEKDEFTESATPLDINALEQAHLRNGKGPMFGGQRHPASLPMKTEGAKLNNRTRPNPLTIDTRKANLFGNAVRNGALPLAPAGQRKASTSGRSPLSQTVETIEPAVDPASNNPEIVTSKSLTGDTVQSRAAGRFRTNNNNGNNNNNAVSASLQVSEPYNKASPTWINGKPEIDRNKASPSPTNRRRAAVDQFVKAQQAAINGESEEFLAEEQGNNGISVVVSSFVNQHGQEEDGEMEDVNFEEPQVNIKALSDYDEREMVQRSPQHSEGVNISDNAHYAQWNQTEPDVLEIDGDGSEHYRDGKRPDMSSPPHEEEEVNDAESWHEGLESYIITEEPPVDDNTNQASTSIDSINQLAVTYPEVWYRPSPAPTPRPADQADANQKSASIRPVRLHYQGKRPKRVLLQLKEEEEEGEEEEEVGDHHGVVENS